jgi:hypothetical protein
MHQRHDLGDLTISNDLRINRDVDKRLRNDRELMALTERRYSVKELAEMWGLSPAAIRRLFRNEPGVLRFGREKKGHQRDYVTLRLPASVVERVYRRCMGTGFVSTPVAAGKKVGM